MGDSGGIATLQPPLSGRYDPGWEPARIRFGPGCRAQLAAEAAELGVRRLMLVSGQTLARQSGLVECVAEQLGRLVVARFDGAREHTPRQAVLDGAALARAHAVDGLVSIGGGTAVDTAKGIALALGMGLGFPADFDRAYVETNSANRGLGAALTLPPTIALPTTLAAAEHTQGIGMTDEVTRAKHSFSHPALRPALVYLDPALTLETPHRLWASSALKLLDHAIAKATAIEPHPIYRATAREAIEIVGRELERSCREPGNLAVRGRLQIAAWLSMFGTSAITNRFMGLSHALGRQIGAASGAPHGLITGPVLPACIRFNAPVRAAELAELAPAFGLESRRKPDEQVALQVADEIAALAGRLELPTRLREIHVARNALPEIAERTLRDPSTAANPRPVEHATEIVRLLEEIW